MSSTDLLAADMYCNTTLDGNCISEDERCMHSIVRVFEGKYRFLSNFWSCFIQYEGLEFPSVENAYQAAKMRFQFDRNKFINIKASEAKKLGRVLAMRLHWNELRIGVMHDLVLQKFQTSKQLKDKLIDTGYATLEEGNWWGDAFWGKVNGEGENHLGKILMSVRDKLRNET